MPYAEVTLYSPLDASEYAQANDLVGQLINFLVSLPYIGVQVVSDNNPARGINRVIVFTFGGNPRKLRIQTQTPTNIQLSLANLAGTNMAFSPAVTTGSLQGRLIRVLYSADVLIISDLGAGTPYGDFRAFKTRNNRWIYLGFQYNYESESDTRLDIISSYSGYLSPDGRSYVIPTYFRYYNDYVKAFDISDKYVQISLGENMLAGVYTRSFVVQNDKYYYIELASSNYVRAIRE